MTTAPRKSTADTFFDPDADQAIRPAIAALRKVRRRARTLLIIRAWSFVIAGLIAAALVWGLIDFALRFPPALRVVVLGVGLVVLALAVSRLVIPANRFRPRLTEIALKVERHQDAELLREQLASAIDLARQHDPAEDELTRALRLHAIETAAARFDTKVLHGSIAHKPVIRAASILLVALAVAGAVWAASPALSAIGAQRVFAPWVGAEWPKRFTIADATDRDVHPSDTALPVRGLITKTTRAIGETMVVARYRIFSGESNRAGEWRRAVLTGQGRSLEVNGTTGELYERLIEPAAFGTDGASAIEYELVTEDDATERRRIVLVAPPELKNATATITPPAYAGAIGVESTIASGAIDMGRGDDERAIVGPVLVGSDVALELTWSKNIPIPEQEPNWAAQLRAASSSFSYEPRANGATIELTLAGSVRSSVHLEDEFGLSSRGEISFSFEALEDRPPTASVTSPPRDETVRATAVVDLLGEARDDLGLVSIALDRQIARGVPDSEGAPPEPEASILSLARNDDVNAREASIETRLDLATLGVNAGDEVWITAIAADTFEVAGARHEMTRSAVRRLRIITESELVEQIRGELGGIRRAAMRLDDQQSELERSVDQANDDHVAVSESDQRRQAALTQRLSEQREILDRLAGRQRQNGLDDPALEGLLSDAAAILNRAASSSSDAASRLEEASADPEAGEQQQQAMQESREAQSDVRDELGQLVELLDRGEDGWVVRRSLERLLEEQRRLMDETQQLGNRTVGRDLSELNQSELSELERISQRQRDAAEQSRDAVDDLAERARQMRDIDPAQAEAMRQAAQNAREKQLSEQLEQAGEQIEQNQTGAAQESQQQAIENLEEMLEELDNAERSRDAALRRQLASLIESIKNLIGVQERELARLAETPFESLALLDRGMIDLNENTTAVEVEARAQFSELGGVADLLVEAMTSQIEAITALRAEPPNPAAATHGENGSLLSLREALSLAEEMQDDAEQREQERVRRELRQAYRDALEQQVALRGETEPLAGKQLSRRDRAAARSLGGRQDTLRTMLTEIADESEALREATVFDLAHLRLDGLMSTAAASLGEGSPDARTIRDQTQAIDLLQSLVEVLAPQDMAQQDFSEGEGSSGGQQGGQQGSQQQQGVIMPIMELRLLRAMQQQAATMTRSYAESDADPDADEAQSVSNLQRSLAERGAELLDSLLNPPTPEQDEDGPDEPEVPQP